MREKLTSDQKSFIYAASKKVALSAGAGSGKTRVLVDRIMRILAAQDLAQYDKDKNASQYLHITDFLVITFTKKAAGELRSRLEEELQRHAKKAVSELRSCLEEELQQHVKKANANTLNYWMRQLEILSRAQISTIHGLASRILREHPLELGLDPDFTLLEEASDKERRHTILRAFLRKQVTNRDEDLQNIIAVYGGRRLLEMLESLLGQLDDLEGLPILPDLERPYRQDLNTPAHWQELEQKFEAISAYVVPLKSQDKVYATKLAKLKAEHDEIARQIFVEHDFQGYDAIMKGINPCTALASLIKEFREERAKIEAREMNERVLELLPAWQHVLSKLCDYWQKSKYEREELNYDDLEVKACKLLEGQPAIRASYQKRWRYLLVDEFQDTNNRQYRLIKQLTEGESGAELCIVGDAKQSIYRFRGADVQVFQKAQEEIAEASDGVKLTMYDNFRSTDKILNAVNQVFRYWMQEDKTQAVQFEELRHNRLSEEKPLFLRTLVSNKLSHTQKEAEKVAAAIKASLERPYSILGDDAPPEPQYPQYSDIYILLANFNKLPELTQALTEAGIPFKVHNGRGLYECQEVLDFLHLWQALLNKHANIELAGALRSPLFGFSDATLTQLFFAAQDRARAIANITNAAVRPSLLETLLTCDAAAFAAGQSELVARAQVILKRLRTAVAVLGLCQVWLLALDLLKPQAILLRQKYGRQKWANLEKLRTLAFSYAQTEHASLSDWLEHVALLRKHKVRETAATLAENDAVTIMTIHSAKGLQAKTIVLPFLAEGGGNDNSGVKFRCGEGLGLKAINNAAEEKESAVYLKLKASEAKDDYQESLRLLYVAMTRAENRLILSGSEKIKEQSKEKAPQDATQETVEKICTQAPANTDEKDKPKKYYALLLKTPGIEEVVEIVTNEVKSANAATSTAEAAETQLEAPQELSPAAKEFAQALDAAHGVKRVFSPSALQDYLHCQRAYFYRYLIHMPDLSKLLGTAQQATSEGKLSPLELGSVLHKALELLYLAKEATPAERAATLDAVLQRSFSLVMPQFPKSGPAYDEALALLNTYTAGEHYASIHPEHARERQFTWRHGPWEFHGVFDCYYQDAQGACQIIDYKTGRAPLTPQNVNLGYGCQLAIYSAAARELYGAKTVAAELHFLRGDSAWPLTNEAEYLAKALDLCQEIHAKKDEEAAFSCDGKAKGRCAYCEYQQFCRALEVAHD